MSGLWLPVWIINYFSFCLDDASYLSPLSHLWERVRVRVLKFYAFYNSKWQRQDPHPPSGHLLPQVGEGKKCRPAFTLFISITVESRWLTLACRRLAAMDGSLNNREVVPGASRSKSTTLT